MARVRKNLAMQGLTGSIGDQLVLRTDKAGRTIVGVKPTYSDNRAFSPAQLEHQQMFRDGVAYAKANKDLDVYQQKAQGTPQNAYNIALADWFNKPQIKEVDDSAWTGEAGQLIRVWAVDDVKVNKVRVVISDPDGNVVEEGEAAPGEGIWWHYTTTSPAGPEAALRVKAEDLPGNLAEKNG